MNLTLEGAPLLIASDGGSTVVLEVLSAYKAISGGSSPGMNFVVGRILDQILVATGKRTYRGASTAE